MADINISLQPIVSTTVAALGGGTTEIATIMKRITEIQKTIQQLAHSPGTPEQKKLQMKGLQAELTVLTQRMAQLQEEQSKKPKGNGSVVASALAPAAGDKKSPLSLNIKNDSKTQAPAKTQSQTSAQTSTDASVDTPADDKLAPAGEAGSVINTYA
ncbi:FlxA-like family protein [Undibacterium sp.]|uniref:FlxA-like family protein n=1 Tax=Undibacterium sp. TaxID=1914977 RepID=UPI00374DDE2F